MARVSLTWKNGVQHNSFIQFTDVVLYTIAGVIFTVIVQAALNTALSPIGISTFTAPFVLATWLFLLPKEKFAPRTV